MIILRPSTVIFFCTVLLVSGAYLGVLYHDLAEQDFISAIEDKDEKAVFAALQHGVDPNTRKSHPAPENADEWLRQHSVWRNRSWSRAQPTALCLAIANGSSPRVVRALLQAGANPNADNSGRRETPLFLAVHSTEAETFQLLLDFHADVNRIYTEGTILWYAQSAHNTRAVHLLRQYAPTLTEYNKKPPKAARLSEARE